MVFEKYRARKSYLKELKSYSAQQLEIEHYKLRNSIAMPPSYEEICATAREDSVSGMVRRDSGSPVPAIVMRTAS